jgi:hypothetical protein
VPALWLEGLCRKVDRGQVMIHLVSVLSDFLSHATITSTNVFDF